MSEKSRGGPAGRPAVESEQASAASGETRQIVRHEELADIATFEAVSSLRARKVVDDVPVEQVETLASQHEDVERIAAEPGDSGEVEHLPDGSVSIPLFEEHLVITKEVVVRERVVIRRRTTTRRERVRADLRRERIEIEGDVEPAGP